MASFRLSRVVTALNRKVQVSGAEQGITPTRIIPGNKFSPNRDTT